MISDEELEKIANEPQYTVPITYFEEMARELLRRRESGQLLSDLEFVDDNCTFYAHSPERLAELLAEDQLGDNGDMTTGVAIKHRGKIMRIWLTGGEDRIVNWEWVK